MRAVVDSVFRLIVCVLAALCLSVFIAKTAKQDMGDPPEKLVGYPADEPPDAPVNVYYPDGNGSDD